ncbi:Protein YABBY 6 [Zostera marina]|uniref:Protein YABBY 6 n=1 Tax=Zostera marina TaxID=29655 RepID=A0A0K9Q1Z1_ZOSMR|nr:Protein YABBY 6 [Zostera marina]
MSLEAVPAEHVCYVNCNFCNTILAVSVPCNTMFNIVTVRCGHCANLLSVNLGGTLHPNVGIPYNQSKSLQNGNIRGLDRHGIMECGSSSSSRKCNKIASVKNMNKQFLPSIHPPPEKRQRVPSAYNRFIKAEIQRIKSNNPDISHREAFSAASKNWAHFPRIHLNHNMEADKEMRHGDEVIAGGRRDPKLRHN